MTALVRAEILRFASRRLLMGLTALVLCGFLVGGVAAFISSDDSPSRIAAARDAHRAEVATCVKEVERSGARQGFPPEAIEDPRAWCNEQIWTSDPRFAYVDFNWMVLGLGIPLLVLGWLIGASFIGAEWANRTIVTTLTWEPRRTRVWLAKALVVAGGTWLWLVLLQAAFAAAMFPAAFFEGSTEGLDAAWWVALGADVARIAAVGAGAAVTGFSVATIGRNTAAAFGVGFVYLAIVESVIRAYRPSWIDWLLGDNIAMALMGSEGSSLGHSQVAAALVALAYAAGLAVLAVAIFRRRDLA